jgi:hypothetical protein
MSTSSEENFILSSVARSYLPPLSLELAAERMGVGVETDFARTVVYTHYLVARGDFNALVDFLDAKSADERDRIVNHAVYETYWGNVLHTCLYWNTGTGALNIYRYLVGCGARAVHDYYEQYPWEQDGSHYICPLRGFDVATDFHREPAEFAQTYADVQRFFGPAGGAGAETIVDFIPPPIAPVPFSWSEAVSTSPAAHDERRALCPLHRPNSIYTRNSEGYYGSFTPACNGCAVGAQEEQEQVVTDSIRTRTVELRVLWLTRYDEEATIDATSIAEALEADIVTLEGMTTVVVTPIDYARRVLTAHRAALDLHGALTTLSINVAEYRNALQQSINDGDLGSTGGSAPILAAPAVTIVG